MKWLYINGFRIAIYPAKHYAIPDREHKRCHCGEIAIATGLCNKHYLREYRA